MPGAPESSPLFRRFTRSSGSRRRMPPLGSEVLDVDGGRILTRGSDELEQAENTR